MLSCILQRTDAVGLAAGVPDLVMEAVIGRAVQAPCCMSRSFCACLLPALLAASPAIRVLVSRCQHA